MDILLKRILKLTYAATTFEQPLSSIRSKWIPLNNFRFLRKSNPALFQRELCEHFLAYRYSKNDTEDSLH